MNQGGQAGDYLRDGLIDDQGKVRIEYLLDRADSVAGRFAASDAASLRTFYQVLKGYVDPMVNGQRDWPTTRELIATLTGKAAYQGGRNVASASFASFIRRNVDTAITSPEAAKAFLLHYQAVIGYWRGRNPGRA